MTSTDAFDAENEHLRVVLAKIRQQLEADRLKYLEVDDDLNDDEAQTADEVADIAVRGLERERFHKLRSAEREPYFGRLDFQEDGELRTDQLYIGKRGIDDTETSKRMIVDWRAPAASLFYSFSSAEQGASYDAPDGEVHGRVRLKRNIAVRDSKLQRVVDSYVEGQELDSAVDEFLLYRLADNKDNRLQDIVSTIQAEQNEIIRSAKNQAIVIQGVAGSGKTTVALHRLAYLLYQHQDRLRADRMVIFAPNAMFIDYISEVLPELGVGDIAQMTFANFALRVLEYQVLLQGQAHRLRDWFGLKDASLRNIEYQDIEAKGQMHFLHEIDEYLARLEHDIVPDEAFEPLDGTVLSTETIARWFDLDYARYPLAQRVRRVLARVKRWMEMQLKSVESSNAKTSKRKAASRLKSFDKLWPNLSPLTVYRDVLNAHSTLSSETIQKPRRRGERYHVQTEDLAPLLYIHAKLFGIDVRDRFDHVVIDEAQDFSPAQVTVLRQYCQSDAFTILGDVSQSIHTYQGIANWSSFTDQFETDKVAYFELDVSYRSTLEIIEFANQIIRPFSQYREAKPVFRSGEPVVIEQVEWRDRLERAVDALQNVREHSNTVALLARTEEDAHVYHHACLEAGLDAHLIDVTQTQYLGGVSILPVYLAKGLEFDSVLLVDVDHRHYDDSALSAKLLYVGSTRALHRLRIHYTDDRSPLIVQSDEVSG